MSLSPNFNFDELLENLKRKPYPEAIDLLAREVMRLDLPIADYDGNGQALLMLRGMVDYLNRAVKLLSFLQTGNESLLDGEKDFEKFRPSANIWQNSLR